MKHATTAVFALLIVWIASYFYTYFVIGGVNFFVPSFVALLSGLALIISPYPSVPSFFMHLRFGRAFYSLLLPGLIAFFGSSKLAPNWLIIPPMVGLFLLTSALVDRMDARHN